MVFAATNDGVAPALVCTSQWQMAAWLGDMVVNQYLYEYDRYLQVNEHLHMKDQSNRQISRICPHSNSIYLW